MTTPKTPKPKLTPADLKPLMLLQYGGGRTLLKVSTIYPQHITAQVLLDNGELTSRTTVRMYLASQVATMKPASAQICDKYDELLNRRDNAPAPATEHSATGICTLAPERPHADVGICRACMEQGLFDDLVNGRES